jgi:hypothetical protein
LQLKKLLVVQVAQQLCPARVKMSLAALLPTLLLFQLHIPTTRETVPQLQGTVIATHMLPSDTTYEQNVVDAAVCTKAQASSTVLLLLPLLLESAAALVHQTAQLPP